MTPIAACSQAIPGASGAPIPARSSPKHGRNCLRVRGRAATACFAVDVLDYTMMNRDQSQIGHASPPVSDRYFRAHGKLRSQAALTFAAEGLRDRQRIATLPRSYQNFLSS